LVFASGDEFEVVEIPQVDALQPNETIQLELTLRAPNAYRTYLSIWQLQDGDGNVIGDNLRITTRVGLTPTPVPATPTTTPTPEPVATPEAPLWMSDPALVGPCNGSSAGYHGGAVGWGVGGGNSDNYHYFYGGPISSQELLNPYNEFSGFPHSQTYFTVSGPGEDWPQPADCGLSSWGDSGDCSTADGYQVVWKKVWITSDYCP
jgi:hypothetical protein